MKEILFQSIINSQSTVVVFMSSSRRSSRL